MIPTIRHRSPVTGRETALNFDLDRLFDGLLDVSTARYSPGAADLAETEEAYELTLDVPGFADEEVELTVDRGILTVSGARRSETEEEGKKYHVRERRFERFTRSFHLPASVRAEDIAAELDSGVLTVVLPKAPEAMPRRIPVSRN